MPLLLSFFNQYLLLFFFTTSYILVEYGVLILDQEIQSAVDGLEYVERKDQLEIIQHER